MIFKFTWPSRPEMGDKYIDVPQIQFGRDAETDDLMLTVAGGTFWLDPDGIEVYMLGPDGRTIDKPRLPMAVKRG